MTTHVRSYILVLNILIHVYVIEYVETGFEWLIEMCRKEYYINKRKQISLQKCYQTALPVHTNDEYMFRLMDI